MSAVVPAAYALAGLALFVMGAHGVFTRRHPLRKVLALNVLSAGVFLVLVATASRAPGVPPDPVPHAMVLTGLVVSVSATALALALAIGGRRCTGDR